MMVSFNDHGNGNGHNGKKRPPATSLLDRQPPCNLEAERGVLGSILLLPEVFDDVASVVTASDFYDDANQQIYKHILRMHEEGEQIDVTLLVNRLKDAGVYDDIGGAAYLAEIANSVPTAANAQYYADIVREKARLRLLVQLATEAARRAYENYPSGAVAAWIAGNLELIENGRRSELITANEAVDAALQRVEQLRAGAGVGGLPTGLRDFDQQVGGLNPGELIVLAARPRCGKTALALQVAMLAAQRGQRVLMFSLEMSAGELMTRALCGATLLDSARIRTGRTSEEEVAALEEAGDLHRSLPLEIDARGCVTVADIGRTARHVKRNRKLELLVVDHLQLLDHEGDSRANRNEQISAMTRALKKLARELGVPLVLLCQLNRESEKATDHRPRLGQLRDSGSIEQDADLVLLLHREELYRDDPDLVGQAELIVGKNRNGPSPTIRLTWNATTTTFRNEELRQGQPW